MHVERDRDGWAPTSTRLIEVWRDTMQERNALAQAASVLVMPPGERKLDPDCSGREPDDSAMGAWLAELVRYTLCSESVGIVLGGGRKTPLRLLATAGKAARNSKAWWNTVRADVVSLAVSDEVSANYRPVARRVVREDGSRADTTPPVVRLPLPLSTRGRRFGLLVVEFVLGERIMPDTLLTARALAQLVAMTLDHAHLDRERERLAASEAQLRRENANLETAMIQSVHELRGPLTTMRLASQLAERRLRQFDESRQQGAVRNINFVRAINAAALANQSVDKAERLLADLTDVARIRAGSLEMRIAPCDLARVVGEAVASQRVAWPKRIIHLDLPCECVSVLADADRVSQVIGNYITNALKYSPTSQPVEVRMVIAAGEARVAVQDHGIGLSAENRNHVWERFYRTDQFHTAKSDGLGVGLFICRQVVEQMGGKVGVDSAPRAGSTFWFTMPSMAV